MTSGDYKPVPDETVEVLERLVDAIANITRAHAATDGDSDTPIGRDARGRFDAALLRARAHLEEIHP